MIKETSSLQVLNLKSKCLLFPVLVNSQLHTSLPLPHFVDNHVGPAGVEAIVKALEFNTSLRILNLWGKSPYLSVVSEKSLILILPQIPSLPPPHPSPYPPPDDGR